MESKMTIFDVLNFLSVYSSLLPLLLGMILIKHLDISSKLLLLLLSFANVAQFASLLPEISRVYIFYNVYTIIDLVLWALIFAYNITNTRHRKIILSIAGSLAVLYVAVNIRNGFGTRFFNEFVCINSVLQLLWVLTYFYEQYKGEELRSLGRQPIFWLCLGLLVYAPCTYFVFAFYNVIMDESSYSHLAMIHSILNVIMYLIFSIGMYMNVKRPLNA
jgi:hypothetical protein